MRLRLYFDEFGKIFLPIPPLEQQQIVTYIEEKSKKIDALKTKYQQEINLMNNWGVRQVKLVISCKVKVLVWVNQWIDFIRFNQPPVSSVARLAERCLWLMATANVNNSCEAYTEKNK